MKKYYLLLFIFLMTFGTTIADPGNGGGNLPLVIRTTNTGSTQNPLPKSPILIPVVYLDGNVLSFDESLEGCTVQLLDESENIIFADFIEKNQTSVTFPSTLTGTYELQIVRGGITFYCYIEL